MSEEKEKKRGKARKKNQCKRALRSVAADWLRLSHASFFDGAVVLVKKSGNNQPARRLDQAWQWDALASSPHNYENFCATA